jgi:hypothetical protein
MRVLIGYTGLGLDVRRANLPSIPKVNSNSPPGLSGKESGEVRSFSKKVILMLELYE